MSSPPVVSPIESLVPLGDRLRSALASLVTALPPGPRTPTALARRLGINRVIASRLLNAIVRPDPLEVIQRLPGPESLRTIVRGCAELGVPRELTSTADDAIDDFAGAIGTLFGTRDALHAAISSQSGLLQARFELDSRYHVFKGMRQVLGIEAETWLTCMFFAPTLDDDVHLDVTTIHGALGMRRLRPDANLTFTFGPPYHEPGARSDPSRSSIDLRPYYTRAPAPLETDLVDGRLHHRLIHDALGRDAVVDMLAVSHNARGSQRFAPAARPRRGAAIFVDVPAKLLVCDVLVHETVFPGVTPELLVYVPGARGPADPNDPRRDIDRISVQDRVVAVAAGADRFDLPEVPRYGAMVDLVSRAIAHPPESFRVFRLLMPYPVHGFQFVVAFDAPMAPGT